MDACTLRADFGYKSIWRRRRKSGIRATKRQKATGIIRAQNNPTWRCAMLFQRFLDDQSASVLPLLALAAIPVVGLIGASVDYSRAAAVQTAMQAAVDSTSLALAKNAASQTADQLTTSAQAYFNAVFTRTDAAPPNVSVSYSTNGGSQVV